MKGLFIHYSCHYNQKETGQREEKPGGAKDRGERRDMSNGERPAPVFCFFSECVYLFCLQK